MGRLRASEADRRSQEKGSVGVALSVLVIVLTAAVTLAIAAHPLALAGLVPVLAGVRKLIPVVSGADDEPEEK